MPNQFFFKIIEQLGSFMRDPEWALHAVQWPVAGGRPPHFGGVVLDFLQPEL